MIVLGVVCNAGDRQRSASPIASTIAHTCCTTISLQRPEKFNRDRMDDDQVLAFLRAELAKNPRAGWTLLLRTLRASNRACEQGRFRELHKRVRDELARAHQQGLKLDPT